MEEELITLRREFHKYPEVAFKEISTSKKIENYLSQLDLDVKTGVGKTGVTALLEGKQPGKTIAIRADIDALPIEEETGLSYSSKNKGVMHACGHDGHIAILLITAKVLTQLKDKIKGNVKFIFQPAEESLMGAKSMIEDNVLKNPDIDLIIGLHIWPDINSGYVGIRSGPVMAAVDKFDIEIKGKGGHGAIPHKSVDPIIEASEIVISTQKIISREIDPLKAAVITFGVIKGGTAFNIIPDKVFLSGTVRTFDSDVREFISERMEVIINSVTKGSRGNYHLKYTYGVPACINDHKTSEELKRVVRNIIGDENLVESFDPSMGGEDFALYQQKVPGVFFFLGGKSDKSIQYPIHHSQYCIDEKVLKLGVKIYCHFVMSYSN